MYNQVSFTRVRNISSILSAFDVENPGMRSFLFKASEWSSFALSLHTALYKYGKLSEKQLQAARSMKAKSEGRQAAQDAAFVSAPTTYAELARAFLSSSASLKRPKLRLRTEDGQRVVLSRCGSKSKTPGFINITDGGPFGEGMYFGKISPEGRVSFRSAPDTVIALLNDFNANPQDAIKVQGVRTGECCCCGRELTDPISIANGIGPVCAEKWGF